jgi:hypothetical protein
VQIEHRVAFKHVIDRSRQFMRQDGYSFAFAMVLFQAGEIFLARWIVPQTQHRGCGEGPLERGLADLRA